MVFLITRIFVTSLHHVELSLKFYRRGTFTIFRHCCETLHAILSSWDFPWDWIESEQVNLSGIGSL